MELIPKSYLIRGGGYQNPFFEKLKNEVEVIHINDIYKKKTHFLEVDRIYVASDDALSCVKKLSKNQNNIRTMDLFKNKCKFRECTKNLFPDFYFSNCSIEDLSSFQFDFSHSDKYIIKPEHGFFSVGVRTINKNSDIKKIADEIKKEIEEKSKYHHNMISKNLIIEEWIGCSKQQIKNDFDGEEFAVDFYYNSLGKAVIINIYHHPKSKNKAYFHLLYYTSNEIFDKFYDKSIRFLNSINATLHATSFPAHAEFKFVYDTLIPIEINPYRFGGFGLGNLAYYAFGFNPYLAYFNEVNPDWKAIWDERKNNHYGWVCSYNGTKMDKKNQQPNYIKFKAALGDKILDWQYIEYQENPVFGLAYIKKQNKKELLTISEIEFNDYIEEKNKWNLK